MASPRIAQRRYGLGYLFYIITELQRELAKLVKYRLYLFGFNKNLVLHFDRSFQAILGLAALSY